VNKHDGTEIGTYEWQVDTTANLLAASVCELSGCSSAAMDRVEITLRDILSYVDPLAINVLYHQINQAFTECDDE